MFSAATDLERAVLEVERGRLQTLLSRWLEIERARTPFTVVAIEEAREVQLATLELRVRLDRVDRLDDGSEVIIDYKTGRCSRKDWLAPRMNEPQLPLYAVAGESPHTRAIAYARVDSVKPEWLASDYEDEAQWAALCADWSADLALLAAEISAGLALVNPKRGAQTCRVCQFDLLCRVRDVSHFGADDDEPDSDAEADAGEGSHDGQ
jgi:RecB family exonuclease